MIESIIHYARLIVSCGPCASIPYASIACSLFALPLLVVVQMLYWFFPTACIILLSLSALIILVSFLIVLFFSQPTDFIVDKIIGVMLAFISIPFTAKFMIVGLVLFHCIRLFSPLILKTFARSLNYSVWYAVLASLGAGLLSNAFLRFAMWVGA